MVTATRYLPHRACLLRQHLWAAMEAVPQEVIGKVRCAYLPHGTLAHSAEAKKKIVNKYHLVCWKKKEVHSCVRVK